MWVFGYGSLIWKVDFPYKHREVGYINGFVRRMWQGSEDHRGVPTALGRVLTLLREDEWRRDYAHRDPHTQLPPLGRVWGVCYKIRDEDVPAVSAHLDHREKGGYCTYKVPFFTTIPASQGAGMSASAGAGSVSATSHAPAGGAADGEDTLRPAHDALVYIATPENTTFLGPGESFDAVVRQICTARGPSGWNIDYVFGLINALRSGIGEFALDEHLVELERACLAQVTDPATLARIRAVGVNPFDEEDVDSVEDLKGVAAGAAKGKALHPSSSSADIDAKGRARAPTEDLDERLEHVMMDEDAEWEMYSNSSISAKNSCD